MMICQRLACVALSTNSSVATSHEIQLSILLRNHCWVVCKLAVFAFVSALASRHSSLTILILMPKEKTVAAKEYRHSILFLDDAGSASEAPLPFLCLLHLISLLHHQLPCILMLHAPQWYPKSGSLVLLYQICLPKK